MPANYVNMMNLNSGETIGLSYDVQIEYLTNVAGYVFINDPDANPVFATTTPSLDGVTPNVATLTIAHDAPASDGDVITATLTDSSGGGTNPPLATDSADSVIVADFTLTDPTTPGSPPVQILTPAPEGIRGLLKIPTGSALSGPYDPNQGQQVLLLIEERISGSKHRQLVFADPAKVTPATKTWSHPKLDVAYRGMWLLVVLAKTDGTVVAVLRYKLK